MAGKTKIGGTDYTISGGKTRVNGTIYSIKGGKTRVNGTVYDIQFLNYEAALDELFSTMTVLEIAGTDSRSTGEVSLGDQSSISYGQYYITANAEVSDSLFSLVQWTGKPEGDYAENDYPVFAVWSPYANDLPAHWHSPNIYVGRPGGTAIGNYRAATIAKVNFIKEPLNLLSSISESTKVFDGSSSGNTLELSTDGLNGINYIFGFSKDKFSIGKYKDGVFTLLNPSAPAYGMLELNNNVIKFQGKYGGLRGSIHALKLVE